MSRRITHSTRTELEEASKEFLASEEKRLIADTMREIQERRERMMQYRHSQAEEKNDRYCER